MAVLALMAGFSSRAEASAVATLHERARTLHISSFIYFYGPAATPDRVEDILDEINRLWNNAGGRPFRVYLPSSSRPVHVRFEVNGIVVPERFAHAIAMKNRSPRINFVRLETATHVFTRVPHLPRPARSRVLEIGGNVGVWYISDELGKSTTAAHEYGHGLGLKHPAREDWRGHGVPPIMAPRGNLVDARYQWNAGVKAGAPGGTLDPRKRKVTQWDIDQLQLNRLTFDRSNVAPIGITVNKLYGENETIVPVTPWLGWYEN